ncbi:MAG TPA: thioesterase family protein [Terriglobia bacterium]|nr:thioesterase family protein [Terriglobia bacterium]
MIHHCTEIRVRYADTDQMNGVYYGKYFEYFEQGRSDLMRAIGLPYGVLEAQGYFLPVIEAHADYRKRARYDDLLQVETRLNEIPEARIRLDYTIVRLPDKEAIAEGYTVHSFVHASTGRPTRAPGVFLDVINKAFANTGGTQ